MWDMAQWALIAALLILIVLGIYKSRDDYRTWWKRQVRKDHARKGERE